jgi:opacity protein-like surface antigen
MARAFVLAAVAASVLLPSAGQAQARWSVELRGGPALATQKLGGADLDAGFGFDATAGYRFSPHVSAYVGWDWLRFPSHERIADDPYRAFPCAGGGAGTCWPAASRLDFEETGYAFGVQLDHPFRGEVGGAGYRLRLGGTYNHIEVENAAGRLIEDSGHGLGWEIGTGVIFPFGDAWRATPGIRYRSLGRTLTFGSVDADVDLTYVTLEVGLSRHF